MEFNRSRSQSSGMLLSRSSAPRMSLLQLKFCTSCIRTRLWVVGRRGRWVGRALEVRWRAPPCATFSRVNRNMKTFYGCCCCCCSRSSRATHIVYILYIVFFSLPPHAAPPLYFASVTGHSPTHTHTYTRVSFRRALHFDVARVEIAL